MKFTMYQLDRVLQQSWTTHMGVKISFADFLSKYEDLTFKSSTNERIRWFFILSFGSIWRYFETTRRCLFVPHFFFVATKKYGDSYCIQKPKILISYSVPWILRATHMGSLLLRKTTKKMLDPYFFTIQRNSKSPLWCGFKLS